MLETPVVYFIFKRHKLVEKVLNRIREVKPKTLYIISDGPLRSEDIPLINESRRHVSIIADWECDLTLYYYDSNYGPYKSWNMGVRHLFEKHDRAIFLEEDILPSVDYFYFCEELLEKFKDESQIYMISGMNFLGEYPKSQEFSYFFVNKATTWGLAMWKRTYDKFIVGNEILDSEYYKKIIYEYLLGIGDPHWYGHFINLSNQNGYFPDSMEFYLMGINANLLYGSLAIVPSVNLVQNLGATHDSENADEIKLLPKSIWHVFKLKTFNLKFPLTHHKYRIIDYNYQKLLQKKYKSSRLISFSEKAERAFRILIYKGPAALFYKVKKSIKNYIYYDRLKKIEVNKIRKGK